MCNLSSVKIKSAAPLISSVPHKGGLPPVLKPLDYRKTMVLLLICYMTHASAAGRSGYLSSAVQ